MILVIGGRSKVGAALVDELVGRGLPVRVLARAREGAPPFPPEVETVVGDLGDPGSLCEAMGDVEKVFLLCGPTPEQVRLNRNAIDTAKAASVELLVRSSILGSNPSSPATFLRDHGACDAYLRDSGVPHVIVRPNMWLQNVVENTIPSIGADGRFFQNAGDARISMVDTRDAAAVDAAALTGFGGNGDAYDVTGPEALSYYDIATKVSAARGETVTYMDAPDEAVRSVLVGSGMSQWIVGALIDLYRDVRRAGTDGYPAALTDTVQLATGRPPRSLDQLLAEDQ